MIPLFYHMLVTVRAEEYKKKELTNVGVPEDESIAQLIFVPVHLAADNAEQCPAVDQDLDAILLHDLVEGGRFLHVFKVVCETRATLVFHTNSNKLGVWL